LPFFIFIIPQNRKPRVSRPGLVGKEGEEGVYLPEIICSVIRCNVLFLAASSLDFRILTFKEALRFPDLFGDFARFLLFS